VPRSKKSKRLAPSRDPHLAREAKKYDNPIPSREFILELMDARGVPLSFEQIAEALELEDDEDRREALRRRLGAMVRDGQAIRNRKGAFCRVNQKDLIHGRVIAHADGFGFLKPDEGGDDLFIPAREMRGLFHGDRIVARVTGMDRRGRLEVAVVEVLERAVHQVVGRLYEEGGVGFVVPDSKRLTHDIVIPRDYLGGARTGQILVVEIVEQPTRRTQPIGRVVQILGEHMAPGMEIDIAIRANNLPVEWPEEVAQAVQAFGEEVPEEAREGRTDLRDLPLVTIDGADAKDFDDAVYCEAKPKGWRLLVAIADVSAYVAAGSALDVEARKRGNSVYFPGRVIPMLPEVLSNGLCSLNPDVDRLCMTCELYINREGRILRSRFYPAVMRSHARLTYDEVAAILSGDKAAARRRKAVVPHLRHLYDLYQVLLAARKARGAIDFDSTETRFEFDDQGKIERIVPVARNDAHRLIEECMLAANVATARFFQRRRHPALYRNHEGPSAEKLQDLRSFLGEFGLSLPGGDKPKAKDFAQVLEQARGRPEAHLIQSVMLRSLTQAQYSATNLGHFGLAYDAYTHFTSPIRRYPDLIVHRAIRHGLSKAKPAEFEYSVPQLQSIGEHCSATERRADEAVWDVEGWLKCEYMQDKVGGEFDGLITGVSSFGFFVELDGVYVDGLVHITSLDNDYYHFDPVGHRLTGERTGQVYRLGDRVRVRVAAVNLDERKIDFVLAAVPKKRKKSRGGGRRRRRG